MSITHITSLSQLNGILSKSKDKLSVIDFHATWCGPCHMIAPVFEALSKQHKNVNFLKCDVEAARDVSGFYKVAAMPTFVFLKGQTKVDEVRGADRAALEGKVRKHSGGAPGVSAATFSGKGQTLGGPPSTLGPDLQPFYKNLDPQAKVLLGLVGVFFLFWQLS